MIHAKTKQNIILSSLKCIMFFMAIIFITEALEESPAMYCTAVLYQHSWVLLEEKALVDGLTVCRLTALVPLMGIKRGDGSNDEKEEGEEEDERDMRTGDADNRSSPEGEVQSGRMGEEEGDTKPDDGEKEGEAEGEEDSEGVRQGWSLDHRPLSTKNSL